MAYEYTEVRVSVSVFVTQQQMQAILQKPAEVGDQLNARTHHHLQAGGYL